MLINENVILRLGATYLAGPDHVKVLDNGVSVGTAGAPQIRPSDLI